MSENTGDYYSSHWREIESERFDRYEKLFVWRPDQQALFDPAGIEAGHAVLDYGCGPGFVAQEVASWVGDGGSVMGVDLNQDFIDAARGRAQATGLDSRLRFEQVPDGTVPVADATFDRVICKNVLEYVPDAAAQLAELKRVLKPGGRIHLLDSDWSFVVVEPWTPTEIVDFFAAASPAFKEPNIGRRLPGLLRDLDFDPIEVRIIAGADRAGRMLAVLRNMGGYAREFGTLPEAQIQDLLGRAEAALASGHFMAILPQFVVTATR